MTQWVFELAQTFSKRKLRMLAFPRVSYSLMWFAYLVEHLDYRITEILNQQRCKWHINAIFIDSDWACSAGWDPFWVRRPHTLICIKPLSREIRSTVIASNSDPQKNWKCEVAGSMACLWKAEIGGNLLCGPETQNCCSITPPSCMVLLKECTMILLMRMCSCSRNQVSILVIFQIWWFSFRSHQLTIDDWW